MPPFIPKKRLAATPPPSPKPTPVKKQKLADALDAESRNAPGLERQVTFNLGSDDSDSSLSDIGSDQFEDVPTITQHTVSANAQSDDEDDDEFEDVELDQTAAPEQQDDAAGPSSKGPIELKFDVNDDEMNYFVSKAAAGKKGPTRREKEARISTHQLHVRYLLWHNSIRNRWTCDKTVQQTLIAQLPVQIKKEVEKWRRASGLPDQDEPQPAPPKVKKGRKGKPINPREERDWGRPSERLDPGKADMSRGDPLISLLKILSAYWKKRFAITAPGLRKRGYGTKLQLKKDVESYRNDKHDPERHGERICDLKEFREVAKKCEGSRDIGAQLFTALLRGLGIESRLVASLQPAGYGWTKVEQMVPVKQTTKAVKQDLSDSSESGVEPPPPKQRKPTRSSAKKRPPIRKVKGNKEAPIDLDSDAQYEDDSDDESVIDVTPSLPKQRAAKYDRDLAFPIYWAEAISPITSQVIPVDPLVLDKPVASTPELLSTFEPRGAKAENARLVIAYVIGYSDDGTAKDITVRYLRKHIWPGKTKTFRYPIEKIPIYDRTGRIKRYEDFDWFKYIMSGYVRTDAMRAAVDDIEDTADLVPQIPEKKDVDTSVDTLQSLKSSADFVLERFLRREEALRPGAKPDRVFVSGKGDNPKSEPVYRRADVERCLTAESWHKEGRHPKPNETPLKMVPVRAVTLTRKREAEEHERLTGEKQLQGLYSWDQTEYIIPPPIENGIIPRNSYGNIDCFVPSMVPKGAVHIPLRGTVRVCKKLEINYAEAVVGFEFGNKRAVPVINGVVVAKEYEGKVRRMWKEWNDEQQKKEAVKQEKLVLDLWRKFLMGLRIRERVGEMYGKELELGDGEGSGLPLNLKRGVTRDEPIDVDADDKEDVRVTMAGRAESGELEDGSLMGGGFLLSDDEDRSEPEDLVIEHHHDESASIRAAAHNRKGKEKEVHTPGRAAQYPTPVSMSSARKPVVKAKQILRTMQIQEPGGDHESDSELSGLPDSSDGAGRSEGDDPGRQAAESAKSDTLDVASPPPSSDSESTQSSLSTSASDDEEDDYLPLASSRRRSKRIPSAPKSTFKVSTPTQAEDQPARSARTTRSTVQKSTTPSISTTSGRHTTSQSNTKNKNKNNVKVIIDTKQTPLAPSTPSRSQGPARGQAAAATGTRSPYFSPQSKPLKNRQRPA